MGEGHAPIVEQLAAIDRRAQERHEELLARGEALLARGKASDRVFIAAFGEIDASIQRSNERAAEQTAAIRDMRESIRANAQTVLSVLDRLGPAETRSG